MAQAGERARKRQDIALIHLPLIINLTSSMDFKDLNRIKSQKLKLN